MNSFKKTGLFFILAATMIISVSCGKPSDWLVEVHGEVITRSGLDELYYAFHRQFFQQMLGMVTVSKDEIDKFAADPEMVKGVPTLHKQVFMENMINNRLMYTKAKDDGFANRRDVKLLLKYQEVQAVATQYFMDKYRDDFVVTDQEIEKVYNEHRAELAKFPVDEAVKRIKANIVRGKMQRKAMMVYSRLREGSGIKWNEGADKFLMPKFESPVGAESQPAANKAPAK